MLWGEPVVVLGLVQPVMEVVVVFRARAVTGAVGRAVGHHASLQATISPHGLVQVQSGDQWLSDVDAFGPVNRIVIHGSEGALKAHSEDQLVLLHMGLEIRRNTSKGNLLLL